MQEFHPTPEEWAEILAKRAVFQEEEKKAILHIHEGIQMVLKCGTEGGVFSELVMGMLRLCWYHLNSYGINFPESCQEIFDLLSQYVDHLKFLTKPYPLPDELMEALAEGDDVKLAEVHKKYLGK